MQDVGAGCELSFLQTWRDEIAQEVVAFRFLQNVSLATWVLNIGIENLFIKMKNCKTSSSRRGNENAEAMTECQSLQWFCPIRVQLRELKGTDYGNGKPPQSQSTSSLFLDYLIYRWFNHL